MNTCGLVTYTEHDTLIRIRLKLTHHDQELPLSSQPWSSQPPMIALQHRFQSSIPQEQPRD